MAYSDYGAYIWKNGKNVTDLYADESYYAIQDGKKFKFYKQDMVEDFIEENTVCSSGHAVIPFGTFCIEFLKVYSPIIKFSNGAIINTKCLEKVNYSNKSLGIKIIGFSLGTSENINMFNIEYKNDSYCVICGSCVGNGFEYKKLSKYIRKNLYYDEDTKRHYIRTKHDIDLDYVIDKLTRLDDIKFEKYWMKEFGIKPFFKDLFKFQFKNAAFHFNEILERKEIIKWLK